MDVFRTQNSADMPDMFKLLEKKVIFNILAFKLFHMYKLKSGHFYVMLFLSVLGRFYRSSTILSTYISVGDI